MRNCTWNDNSTWHNITPSDTDIAMYNIDGAQDSASGLRSAQSVPLQLTQTDGDAALFTGIIFLILQIKSAEI